MNKPVKQTQRLLALATLVGLAAASLVSYADCVRSPRPDVARAAVTAEPRPDTAVSLGDPALDGMFARYADLHRDTVGYAMTDVIDTSMLAKAVQDPATPSTH